MNFEKVLKTYLVKLLSFTCAACMQKMSGLWFLQVRSLDPYVVNYMDEYAMLLKMKSDYSKLSKLVHDLLNIDSTRPEVYVALSVLWERKDLREALSFAEKVSLLLGIFIFSLWICTNLTNLLFFAQSIRIDDRHIPGHIMRVKKQL